MNYKHLFGPVPSRRIGVSLGIDLVPYKTCTYDCVYCECGKTTNLTIKRKEYVPTNEILQELEDFLKKEPELDYITFSGSGEPTLHIGIGRIVDFLKTKYAQYKIALLTNGALLYDKNVQNAIMDVDLIMPSFDAYSSGIITEINQPANEFDAEQYRKGFKEFFDRYEGNVNVEVFIVKGINDNKEEIKKIDDFLSTINIDMIQLNTMDRPGTENWVESVSREELNMIKRYFTHNNVEVIAKFTSRKKSKAYDSDIKSRILETISRRPCTAQDLATALGLHINKINKYLDVLAAENEVNTKKLKRGTFYFIKK
ncbi:MAG: radical SAM protein [Candidatus Cloacimonetes bacterium]|nr:radical SAM protein [Candidatus Cloacimonadota bacterium]MBS3767496.1 radical SAM protein [Candidatus Cloacimonadota bacterium]